MFHKINSKMTCMSFFGEACDYAHKSSEAPPEGMKHLFRLLEPMLHETILQEDVTNVLVFKS